jgi:hypothetical protein
VKVSDLDLDSKEVTDCDILLTLNLNGAVDIDNGETLNRLLAILELFRVLIECHGSSLLSGEAAVLLKRDILVLLFEVLDSLIINIGELHEVFVIIPHALHDILGESDDGVGGLG